MTRSKSAEATPAVTIEGETFSSPPQRIEYPAIDVPEPGEFATVAPGILWLRIPMPMDLNHINLWLLEDNDGWTLVDSGLNADMCKEAWAKLESKLFALRRLKRIFITHLHPDHVGLARWLQEKHKAIAWMSVRGLEMVQSFLSEPTPADITAAEEFMHSHGYADTANLARFFSGKMYRTNVSGVPEIAHSPQDGDEIDIGATQWRIYETDGHAEGHQCLFDASRRILISGDQVLPTISSNVSRLPRSRDTNPLASYLNSLERLSQLDAHTLVLPSHGRPFYGLRPRASDLIAHHREHLATLQAACSEPRTAFELVPVLFKRRLIDAHWMFAMGETIAHAEYLLQAGKLVRQIDGEGTIRYLHEVNGEQ
ncbi:MAG TPA: MBL fold metallo-hydrolase [Steroidobacteraceae bacterium]|nr:MBL fold metallo-hydrolase [Steroidobacteraceae bacterium]